MLTPETHDKRRGHDGRDDARPHWHGRTVNGHLDLEHDSEQVEQGNGKQQDYGQPRGRFHKSPNGEQVVSVCLSSLALGSMGPPRRFAEENAEMVLRRFEAYSLGRREPVPSPVDIKRQHRHRRAEGLRLTAFTALC